MKIRTSPILIFAIASGLAGAASAEPWSVKIPADLSTPAAQAAYTGALKQLANRACHKAASGSMLPLDTFRVCLAQVHADIARQDKSGLYAEHLASLKPAGKMMTLASK